jgi:hypothetical protein
MYETFERKIRRIAARDPVLRDVGSGGALVCLSGLRHFWANLATREGPINTPRALQKFRTLLFTAHR